MNRTLLVALAACVARPLSGQLVGLMPLWNDPSNTRTSVVAVDLGAPNINAGGGTAYGFRLVATTGFLGATFGLARWSPSAIRPGGPINGQADQVTSLGLGGSARLLGGGQLPLGLNVLAGGNWLHSNIANVEEIALYFGAGVNAKVAARGVGFEPYLSITRRGHNVHDTDAAAMSTGWTVGANADLGRVGLHVGYDVESRTCPYNFPCPPGNSARILGGGIELAW